jgi:hypothetical protein
MADATATAPAPPETQGATPSENAPEVQQTPQERAADDWARTAGPQTQGATPGSQAPQIEQEQPQTVPVAVTSLKRGGILGVMDTVADALAGKTKPELGKGSDGSLYVKQHSLTRGEQWMKIAGEAAVGAAAGLAAGRGAGNMGKGAFAGVQEGQHIAQTQKTDEKEMDAKVRQQQLDDANRQMLRMNMAEQTMRATRLQTEGNQKDIEFAQKQEDRFVKEDGGKVLGTVAQPGDVAKVLNVNPNLAADLVKNHKIELVSDYGEGGKLQGFKVIQMPSGDYRNQMLPPGSIFHTYDPNTSQVIEHHASDPMTAGERDDYDTAAQTALHKFNSDRLEEEQKRADIQAKKATASEAPSVINKNNAEAGKAKAETPAAAAVTTGGAAAELAQYPASTQSAVRGLLTYQVDPGTFPQRKYAKSGQMDRETAIGIAREIDPSYDEKQFGPRRKLIQDFTSGTSSQNIVSLNTAIQHLDRMAKSGAALNNTNNQAINAAKNTIMPWFGATAPGVYLKDVNAVADELSSLFKKTGATDVEIKGWKDEMSKAQTPAQIRTGIDEALELMGGRYDALRQKFETGMGRPQDFQMLSPASKAILKNLGETRMLGRDESITPAAGAQAQMVTVQIPGHPPGQIPASALDQFKLDHKDAIVGNR